MTEDETPLHQIAWTRLKRQLGQPPGFDAEALLYQAMKHHLLALGRALLLSLAIAAAVLWGRTDLDKFTSWLGKQLDWISEYPVLWATLGFLIAALLMTGLEYATLGGESVWTASTMIRFFFGPHSGGPFPMNQMLNGHFLEHD